MWAVLRRQLFYYMHCAWVHWKRHAPQPLRHSTTGRGTDNLEPEICGDVEPHGAMHGNEPSDIDLLSTVYKCVQTTTVPSGHVSGLCGVTDLIARVLTRLSFYAFVRSQSRCRQSERRPGCEPRIHTRVTDHRDYTRSPRAILEILQWFFQTDTIGVRYSDSSHKICNN